MTFDVAVSLPSALLTVSVTEPPLRAAYVTLNCVALSTVGFVPPLAAQVSGRVTPLEVLVNVQTKRLHDLLMLATGGCPPGGGGGGAVNCVYRSRFGVFVPVRPVILLGVALAFNAASTSAGVAPA